MHIPAAKLPPILPLIFYFMWQFVLMTSQEESDLISLLWTEYNRIEYIVIAQEVQLNLLSKSIKY